MANEISGTMGLSVRKTTGGVVLVNHRTQGDSFKDDVMGVAKGPVPGSVAVTVAGGDVSLAQLTVPGWIRLSNQGRSDGGDNTGLYVEWGVHDGSLFHPVGELRPGIPGAMFKMSRNFGEEESLPGTGTTAPTNTLYLRAVGATQNVLVEAFEA